MRSDTLKGKPIKGRVNFEKKNSNSSFAVSFYF